ncbi:MAG: hypothetical protein EPN47_13100 [Acidobacteria bacterium]|nr:MAG: hypothetical protein EPN47_13100 [Acidobacteriota bacterium]
MRCLLTMVLSSILLLGATPAWGHVFIQWTAPTVPSAASIGVTEMVIPWGPGKIQLMKTAKERGYRVFARVNAADSGTVADAVAANGLAGIIVEDGSSEPGHGDMEQLVQKLRGLHPGLAVLILDPGGKQPQIQGNLVIQKNGVLQVSSATREPWIDSNVALARFEQANQPGIARLFSFTWDLAGPVEQKQGPRAVDYALAVAEAGANEAGLVLPLHPNLQKGLAEGDKLAWQEWDRVKTYIRFYSKGGNARLKSMADVAVVADDYRDAYEAMNLLARRNISFRVFRPSDATEQALSGSQLAIVFSRIVGPAIEAIRAFASAGGTVLLIGQHGPFPWQTIPAVKSSIGTTYKTGRGEVIESSQPVGDPEAFAEEVRDLLRSQGPLIYLWNGVTTLSSAHRTPQEAGIVVELVNYAQEPIQVQVRVKGLFPDIRYETPEHGSYPAVAPEIKNGFTQFVISHIIVGARVYLNPKTSQQE